MMHFEIKQSHVERTRELTHPPAILECALLSFLSVVVKFSNRTLKNANG